MAYLRSILRRHFAASEKRFRSRLQKLAVHSLFGPRVKKNFLADPRPSVTAWKLVIREMLRAASRGSAVHEAVRKGIERAQGAGAQSPKARIPIAALTFGRVIAKQQYFHIRFGARSTGAIPEYMQEAHLRQLLDSTFDEQRNMLHRTDLGRFKMWSTFAPVSRDPFDGIPEQATSFRAAFGLDEHPNPAADEMLVLQYSLPSGIEARIPTVCDAYAGPSWPAYFLPARPRAAHGFTDTWIGSGMRPRPEVVHEVITGSTLAAKVRKVTG